MPPLVAAVAAALAVLAVGCRHRGMPPSPPFIPTSEIPAPSAEETPAVTGRNLIVGELCTDAAEGRPAVMPMFLRRGSWQGQPKALTRAIATRSARQFSVLGWDGRRIGVFSALGAAAVGAARKVAIGSYAGSPTCSKPQQIGKRRRSDPVCRAVLGRCAVAIAVLQKAGGPRAEPFAEDPLPPQIPTAKACVAGGFLFVDIDADGKLERYPVAAFYDPGARRPAGRVRARRGGGVSGPCKPAFAVRLAAPGPGAPGLDLLGVFDLDADGHRELLIQYQLRGVTLWALYTSLGPRNRLDRAAVASALRRPGAAAGPPAGHGAADHTRAPR